MAIDIRTYHLKVPLENQDLVQRLDYLAGNWKQTDCLILHTPNCPMTFDKKSEDNSKSRFANIINIFDHIKLLNFNNKIYEREIDFFHSRMKVIEYRVLLRQIHFRQIPKVNTFIRENTPNKSAS